MREGNGVLVIEVKDWNLDNFTLNEKKKWVYTPNGSVVKSPIDQVLKYKNNLFDLHVDQLLQKKIFDVRHFNIGRNHGDRFITVSESAVPASLLVWYISCLYTKNVPLGTLFLWEAGGICRCKDSAFS
jgi:hypothetical protein